MFQTPRTIAFDEFPRSMTVRVFSSNPDNFSFLNVVTFPRPLWAKCHSLSVLMLVLSV
jgi:hypothetical protein